MMDAGFGHTSRALVDSGGLDRVKSPTGFLQGHQRLQLHPFILSRE